MRKIIAVIVLLQLLLFSSAGCSNNNMEVFPAEIKARMKAQDVRTIFQKDYNIEPKVISNRIWGGDEYAFEYQYKFLSKYDTKLMCYFYEETDELTSAMIFFQEQDRTQKTYEYIETWMTKKYGEPEIMEKGRLRWMQKSEFETREYYLTKHNDGIDFSIHFIIGKLLY